MGVLIGIIYGLYFKISIAFIIGIMYFLYYWISNILKQNKNLFRYLKVIIKKNVIFLFCISSIISNTYLLFLNYKYEKLYKDISNNINLNVKVISEVIEKEYTYSYKVKVKDGKKI